MRLGKRRGAAVAASLFFAMLATSRSTVEGQPDAPSLTDLRADLGAREGSRRLQALIWIDRLGPKASTLEDEVLALLEDESPSNRIAAAYGLWRMNPSRQEGPTTLFALLDSTQGSLLEESIRAVGRMGRDAAPAIHSLVERLKDEDARIRRIAAWAIGEVGPAATVAQEELRRIAEHDTDATAKDAARRALTVVVPDESIPDLVEALGEDNEYRRLEAATTLGRIGRDAAAAVPALVVAVEDRRIAEDGEFRGPSQHETLARARLAAAWALGEIGLDGRNVISVLTRVADDVRENAAIREAAGNAMGRLRGATERGATEQSETESDHDNQWGR